MGLDRLSDHARELLFEVARMSCGSREGTSGGRGHIGMLTMHDGTVRVIKFDTHGGESVLGLESSNNLRFVMMDIAKAAGLKQEALDEIRQKLRLHPDGSQVLGKKLLERTVVAQVVELIGGRRIWGEVGYDREVYKSGKDTSFARLMLSEDMAVSRVDTGNVRKVEFVGKGGLESRDGCVGSVRRYIIDRVIEALPSEKRGQVRKLVDRVLSKDSLRNVWSDCFSANEFRAVTLKCLVRILMVRGDVKAGDLQDGVLGKRLGWLGKKTGILEPDWRTKLEKDAYALQWCVDNGKQYAKGTEDADADTLLVETLKRAIKEDIRRGRRSGEAVEMENVGASMSAALKGVFATDVALRELDMFADFARNHQNSGDFYMKFAADGKTLMSAGSRNILRGSDSKAENNDVRQRLMECVTELYKGRIPPSVEAVMTGFDGGGHPLSARRVMLIKAAIDADRLRTAYPGKISLDTLAGTGLTLADVNESIDELSAHYNLSADEKRIVGKMTLAYLASQAEETSDEYRLPDVATLKRQIAEGTCNGTFLALQNLHKIPILDNTQMAGDKLYVVSEAVRAMNEDDAEALAYFAGKFRRVDHAESRRAGYFGASGFLLKDLVERKDELLAFRARHGKMTLGDLWRLRFGTPMPESSRLNQQRWFVDKQILRWIDEFEAKHPGLKAACGITDRLSGSAKRLLFSQKQVSMMLMIQTFGISLEKAAQLSNGQAVGDLDISPRTMVYDTESPVFVGFAKKKSYLVDSVGGDLNRYAGNGGSFDVMGIPGGGNLHFDVNTLTQSTPEMAQQTANGLYDAFAAMLGYGPGNPVPEDDVPNQLKTMMLVSGQAGNVALTLCGIVMSVADHYPTQKTFALLEDGQVRFTVAATVGNRHVSVSFDIAKDGTSSCHEAKIW